MNMNMNMNNSINLSKYNSCNNCGKQGHLFHQCKLPIVSYGLIVYRYRGKEGEGKEGEGKEGEGKEGKENQIEYLMIRRKDSFGYIVFVRGKYSPNDIEYLQNIFNEMSVHEKQYIRDNVFDTLWKTMWQIDDIINIKGEYIISSKKYDILASSGLLEQLLNNSNTEWTETEWEFPKGKRNMLEKEVDCALREFEEETGVPALNISIIENVTPFEETYIGSNHKSYKHKYYLGYVNDICYEMKFQESEVSKIEWKTISECLQCIRPYHMEKKQIITNVDYLLRNYNIV